MVKDNIDVSLLESFDVGFYSNPFANYLGYFLDDEVVGYIEYNILYDRVEIVNIFVKEDKRNSKIGSSMLEYLINSLKRKNIYNITLEVSVLNVYAIKLYEKYGFERVAIRKGYYKGIDGILMELVL